MINQDMQTAAVALYQQGQSKKTIARLLKIDVKTVRTIVAGDAVRTLKPRNDKIDIAESDLEALYHKCDGYIERMYEILTEEQGVAIGYSTLTRLVRSKGLGGKNAHNSRSEHFGDVPGEEMQHDTTIYSLKIGGVQTKVICSGIYLRYSKMRIIRFYLRFNRFTMKCFIDEALRFWGYCARICVIDNTNLAILHGSGSSAVMNPEMIAFADNYGFSWKAHAINHPNRKAGKERNFWTTETNFLPGRTFSSLDNLNEQAFQWATSRYAQRPQAKTKLIPVQAFEYEKSSLLKLPPYISQPYIPLVRKIDTYGYIACDANYFWVPETVQCSRVTVLRYVGDIVIMEGTKELVRYKLPPESVENQKFVPAGVKMKPRGEPNDRKLGCEHEEMRLRQMGDAVQLYLDFIKSVDSGVKKKPLFIRGLYRLSKEIGQSLFEQAVHRANNYHVNTLDTVRRIAYQLLEPALGDQSNSTEIYSDYQKRQTYQIGRFTEENDVDFNEEQS
jgi:transposase